LEIDPSSEPLSDILLTSESDILVLVGL